MRRTIVGMLLLAVLLLVALAPAMAEEKKTGIAVAASWLIPGAGQVYAGEVGRGLGIFLGEAVLVSLANGQDSEGLMWVAVGGWVWQIFDASATAVKYNREHAGRISLAPTVDPQGEGLGLAMRMDF